VLVHLEPVLYSLPTGIQQHPLTSLPNGRILSILHLHRTITWKGGPGNVSPQLAREMC
jgi:hypothetical protein